MVDVGTKHATARTATAEGVIHMSQKAYDSVEGTDGPKGNVLRTAEIAGTMAAKKTHDLIPLCHPIGLDHAEVRATLAPELPGVRVRATTKVTARTGVEMEALTGVTVALLTVYDMVKGLGHDLEIGQIRLVEKLGGKSGDWRRA
jgi:cyclic pyranopterin phosphate synthase